MKKTGRKTKGLWIAVLIAAGLAAGRVRGYAAVLVSDSYYDWEDGADDSGRSLSPGSGYTDRDQGSTGGPGVRETQEAEEIITGPQVIQASLTERYHEEYKIYEESIEGLFFFYTSVANGGITDQAVTLDIPQNIRCTVEKDGGAFDYIPGQAISGNGTYVVRLTSVEDAGAPFSEQKEYRALFRFRIQPKPPGETQEAAGGTSGAYSTPGLSDGGFRPGGTGETGTDEWPWGYSESGGGEESRASAESGSRETEESREEESLGEAESREEEESESPDGAGEETESGEETEPGEQSETREAAGDQEGSVEAVGSVSAGGYSPRTQVYDPSSGKYQVTFENGRTLLSNVPEGYTGPGPVEVTVSGGEAKLYRDDEPVEYMGSGEFGQPGQYRLNLDGQSWSFAVASAVNVMDCYPAPAGMRFTELSFNGEPAQIRDDSYVSMKEDGQYHMVMTGQEGETVEVTLEKDTTPPRVAVTVKGGRAQVQYLSDDISQILLTKNGEIQPGFSGYSVSSPGVYRLSAADEAGNVSSTEFTLKYQVNKYGIAAVILIILVIAGLAAFVVHVKRTVKIR